MNNGIRQPQSTILYYDYNKTCAALRFILAAV